MSERKRDRKMKNEIEIDTYKIEDHERGIETEEMKKNKTFGVPHIAIVRNFF